MHLLILERPALTQHSPSVQPVAMAAGRSGLSAVVVDFDDTLTCGDTIGLILDCCTQQAGNLPYLENSKSPSSPL